LTHVYLGAPRAWLRRRVPLTPYLPGCVRERSLRRESASGLALEPRARAAPRHAKELVAGVLGRALGSGVRAARAAPRCAPRMVGRRARLRRPPAGRLLVRRAAVEGARRWRRLPSVDGADRGRLSRDLRSRRGDHLPVWPQPGRTERLVRRASATSCAVTTALA